MNGTVFDIKEFAVFDGPGIRTTVFMKGCPLRCQWCHNPEGLSTKPQLMVSTAACTHCGACKAHCIKEVCDACGACIPWCHLGLRRIAGEIYTDEQLAKLLLRGEKLLRESEGGITFSGGEPLLQWPFVKSVIGQLNGLHTCIETSGFTTDEIFDDAIHTLDMIIMDVKIVSPSLHKIYCGVDNECILRHARTLLASDIPCMIRTPLIPGITDTEENLTSVARLCEGSRNLLTIELLPYHKTAGAKYGMVGMEYHPDFDTDAPVQATLVPFEELGVPARVM